MQDLLAPTPKRLHRLEGRWVLEVERYLALAPNHYRRMPGKVAGTGAIRKLLEGTLLAQAAARLIEAPSEPGEVVEDASFDAVEGSWHRSSRPADDWLRQDEDPTSPNRDSSMSSSVSHLEAQLSEANSRLRALERRVAQLTQLVSEMRRSGYTPEGGGAGPSMGEGGRDARRGGGGHEGGFNFGGGPEDEPERAASTPREAPPAAEAAPAPAPEPEPEPEPEAPKREVIGPPAFRAPSTDAIHGNLVQLIDGLEPPAEIEAIEWGEEAWVSIVIDDDDNVVGAMVADLVATVQLGGQLLMVPEERLAELIDEGGPDEDVHECMSEVFNTLSATINSTAGNIHVRVRPLEKMAVPEFVHTSASRVDMRETQGGVFTIAAAKKSDD